MLLIESLGLNEKIGIRIPKLNAPVPYPFSPGLESSKFFQWVY